MKAFLTANFWEIIAGVGLLLAFIGVCLVYVPAALTLLGLGLIGLGIWGAKTWAS